MHFKKKKMKHLKRIVILIFCAIFALSAFMFAACEPVTEGADTTPPSDADKEPADKEPEDQEPEDKEPEDKEPEDKEPEDKEPETELFTVTVGAYDTEKGTVTLSAPKNEKGYERLESVTVTAEGKEGFEPAAIYVGGSVMERISATYTFLVTESVTVSAAFCPSTEALPEVTFSSLGVKSFATLFRGHWRSEKGELFIGEKKLSYYGEAVTSVAPRNSGNEQSYNFTAGGTAYSIAWARTDYTVGYVLDVLNIDSGEREYFLPDPLPTEKTEIADVYSGTWTAAGGVTLEVKDGALTYRGAAITDVVDGGFYAKTNDTFGTPIGANIYFFLYEGNLRILMWNGETNCPVIGDEIFNGEEEKAYTFPAALRGTWKSADGKTAVITETSFTLDGTSIPARGSDAAFLFTQDGKEYEGSLYAGSNYILQIVSERYGSDGLIVGGSYEYFFREDRPAVTVNAALEGSWTEIVEKGTPDSFVTVENGVISWDGNEVTVIEAGEARADGYVYFVFAKGKVYELSLLNDGAEWILTLSGTDEVISFAKS